MIIRQRTTYLDSFLLKVVFPYLANRNHQSLLRMAHYYWNNDVSTERPSARPTPMERLREYESGWQHSFHFLARWIQPQQLAPVPALNRRSDRHFRRFRGKQ